MKLALVAVMAALALVAAGCGGDDEAAASADEWAEELCTSVNEWMDELERIGDDLGEASLSRDSLRDAAEEADTATDDFVQRLRDLGTPETESAPAGLTERELDVLRLIARGSTNRSTAEALGISAKTVNAHIEHIYAKTGVRSRAAATLFAMQHDLLG
jgi:DNA-binding CsgD family transcriptional regulator